jgi:hypothetical protein
MPTLPWTVAQPPDADGDVVVLASRLRLRRYRDIPGFLGAATRIRTQVRGSTGAHGVSLIAQPLRKTFWTLSAWKDRAVLDAFVRAQPHVDVMTKYHGRLIDPLFTTWTVPAASAPRARSNAKDLWADGKERLARITEPSG